VFSPGAILTTLNEVYRAHPSHTEGLKLAYSFRPPGGLSSSSPRQRVQPVSLIKLEERCQQLEAKPLPSAHPYLQAVDVYPEVLHHYELSVPPPTARRDPAHRRTDT